MRVAAQRAEGPEASHRAAAPHVVARPVGGHSFTAGGLAKSVTAYLDATAASAVQVYVSNPRGWARPDGSPEQDETFRALCAERDVVAWVHACLLVNLGSPTPATVAQSVETLRHAVRRAGEIGARGVVFHAGSAVDRTREAALEQAGEALMPVLDGLDPDGPRLLVEPSAGGGQCLAKRVKDLGAGTIGLPPFTEILAHPATRNVPVIVETPSARSQDGHAKDIAAIRTLFTR